jgi:hypothetical protein
MLQAILNLAFTELLNVIIKQGNTSQVVVKEQPLFDENNTELTLEEKQYVNLMVLAVQHGEGDGTNDAVVGTKEVFTKDADGNKVLVSTSVTLGSTTHPYGVELFSDGTLIVKAKVYTTTEDAQNDSSLKVGEIYKCNGFVMYKQ